MVNILGKYSQKCLKNQLFFSHHIVDMDVANINETEDQCCHIDQDIYIEKVFVAAKWAFI